MSASTRSSSRARRARAVLHATMVAAVTQLGMGAGSEPAQAARTGSVRAQGMAGAYTAHARGVDAALWNPANLAARGAPRLSIELAGLTAQVANNGVDLDLYNRHTGQVLSEADKQEILAAIPTRGLATAVDATATAVGVQVDRFAISVTGHGLGYTNLPRGVFELLLEGNAAADSVTFDDSEGEAIAFAALNFAGASEVATTPWGGLSVGMNLRYLQGIAYAELEEVTGALVTELDGVYGTALAQLVTAGSGQGAGLDVGVSADLANQWRAGLSVQNVFGVIHYSGDLERRLFLAEVDTVSVVTLEEVESTDELYDDQELRTGAEPFNVTLPRVISLGLAREGERTVYAFEYTQGFTNRAGSSTTPRIALGGEVLATPVLPLRMGLSMGGVMGPSASVGLGLKLGVFGLDLAAASHGKFLPRDTKGVTLSVGTGLRF